MKYRYYVGDPTIPWWVNELVDRGLVIEPYGNAAITCFLTYRETYNNSDIKYLYDGDFLELNEDTGAVTIGHSDWNNALADLFKLTDRPQFVKNIHKNNEDRARKRQNDEHQWHNYWS